MPNVLAKQTKRSKARGGGTQKTSRDFFFGWGVLMLFFDMPMSSTFCAVRGSFQFGLFDFFKNFHFL